MSDDACCPSCERWEAAGKPSYTAGEPGLAITADEAVVVFQQDDGPRQWLRPAGDTVVFGRGAASDVQSDDGRWSRRQSQLRFADGVVYAGDLNSACGTFIDHSLISQDTPIPAGRAMTFAGMRVEVVREVPADAVPYRK